MLRRGVVWVAVASSSLALGACSLLLGEGYTDPNASTGGDAASASDAPNASDASFGDTSVSTSDGGAGDGSGAACPSATVSFCDDFERADPQGAWSRTTIANGGTLVTTATSRGRVLEASISAASATAYVARKFAIQPTHLHWEVTLDFGSLPSTGAVHIFGTGFQNTSEPPAVVYVYADPANVWLVQQVADASGNYRRDALGITPGAPHRVVVDLTIGGATRVHVDSVQVLDLVTASYLFSASPEVSVGASQLGATPGSFTFRADDFVFTAD